MENFSVVVITKNEEVNIRACLESVKWANEIVIIDDYSVDDTVRICREYTDKIHFKKLEGFGEQKQFGIDKAQGSWILVLDADERLSPDLQKEIREMMKKGFSCDGFFILRKTFYLEKWIKHCNWYLPVLRLFRRGKGKFDLRKIHENIILDGKTACLKNPILHDSYRSVSQHVKKLKLFSDYDADELFKQGIRIRAYNVIWYLFLKPVLSFFRKLIIMKGFMDGWRGFLISGFPGAVVFLNYAKLRGKQKDEKCKIKT